MKLEIYSLESNIDKWLGVQVDENRTWTEQVDNQTKQKKNISVFRQMSFSLTLDNRLQIEPYYNCSCLAWKRIRHTLPKMFQRSI